MVRHIGIVLIVALAAYGCVASPAQLRQQEPHAQADSPLPVPAAAHCMAGTAAEEWQGYASATPIMAPDGQTAEVHITTQYQLGVITINPKGTGSHIAVHLLPGGSFPVINTHAAAQRMLRGCEA